MYCETREEHSSACECERCIADRRHEQMATRHEQLVRLAGEQRKSLTDIAETLTGRLTSLAKAGPCPKLKLSADTGVRGTIRALWNTKRKLSEIVTARECMRTGDREAARVVEEDLDTLIEIAQAAKTWELAPPDSDEEYQRRSNLCSILTKVEL